MVVDCERWRAKRKQRNKDAEFEDGLHDEASFHEFRVGKKNEINQSLVGHHVGAGRKGVLWAASSEDKNEGCSSAVQHETAGTAQR
jgi:hypothetical protein